MLYLFLAIIFIRLPSAAVDAGHDMGSRMSFEFYARQNYQFGVDVIQNIGPWGYLLYPHDYSGILPTSKLLFGIVFGLILAWLVVAALRYFPIAARFLFIAAVILAPIPPGDDLDQVIYLFILVAAHHLLAAGRSFRQRVLLDIAIAVSLALLCLMKSTNLALAGLLLLIAITHRLRGRRYVDLGILLGGFTVAAVLLWVLAGQRPGNLGSFIRGAYAFSSGYNEALALMVPQEAALVGYALVIMGLFVLANVIRAWRLRRNATRLLLALFEAACLFVVWKHGFVRADHAVYFWYFVIAAAPALFLGCAAVGPATGREVAQENGWTLVQRRVRSPQALLVVLTFVTLWCGVRAATIGGDYTTLGAALDAPLQRIRSNAAGLVYWSARRRSLVRDLDAHASAIALPLVKRAVGDATIDQFGFLPGVVLLNKLRYTPRPMPITFAASNDALMQRNAAFYRNDAAAPAFILAAIGQLDSRFVPQDDALAMLELLARYRPVLVEKGFLLLKRTPRQVRVSRRPRETQTINWGQRIPIPSDGGFLWCTVEIQTSRLGRLHAFLYKPAPIQIVLQLQGRSLLASRFLTSAGGTGFLASPLVLHNLDLAAAYGIAVEPASSRTPQFDALRLAVAAKDRGDFEPVIKVTFWAVEFR